MAAAMKSSPSCWPDFNFSIPAHATMAALSVHKSRGGATKANLWVSHRSDKCNRKVAFAATPPATTKWAIRGFASLKAFRAAVNQAVRNGLLKTGRKVGFIVIRERRNFFCHKAHRRFKASKGKIASRASLLKDGGNQTVPYCRFWPGFRLQARRDNPALKPAQLYQKLRRRHRQGLCPIIYTCLPLQPPETGNVPPETSNSKKGKGTLWVRRPVKACPSRWFTAMKGRFLAAAMALAVITPTRTPPIRPGPAVTAMPLNSSNPHPRQWRGLSE